MILPKYKLLATLYLCQRFGGSPPPVEFFRHVLGSGYTQTISRLRKEKLIDTLIRTDSSNSQFSTLNSQFKLTYLGTNALLSRFPLLDYFQTPKLSSPPVSGDPEPGKFTLVMFNIPEEKRAVRDRLRYVLKLAGFGQMNRSLYLSPHLTVRESNQLLSLSSLRPRLSELKGEAFGRLGFAFSVPFESFKEMESKTLMSFWNLKKVEELYSEALSVFPSSPPVSGDPEPGFRVKPGMTKVGESGRFLSKFLEAFMQDPFLPPLLLGNNWPGTRALLVAKEILEGFKGI